MLGRLIHYSHPNAAMNEAIEEAILLARQQEQPLDTIRFWGNKKAVVLGESVDLQPSIDKSVCEKKGIAITRRIKSGETIYQDHGTLNLTYIIDQKRFFPRIDELNRIYRMLCRPVAEALEILDVSAEIDEYGQTLFINNKKVCQAGVSFYYDLILFTLSLHVNTDLDTLHQTIRKRENTLTTLVKEIKKPLKIDPIKKVLINKISQAFKIQFEKEKLTPYEHTLSKRLYRIKYSKKEWIQKSKAPLSLKEVLVDVYVAYPPTRSCQTIISTTKSAIENLQDRVEMRIWMRGKGLDGKGVCPAGVVMPAGLIKASKESIIPAVIINGQISFSKTVPTKEDIIKALTQALRSSN